MWSKALLSVRSKDCCRFLSYLKVHRSQPGLNLRTLGAMANTLTIIPPTTTTLHLKMYVFNIVNVHSCNFQLLLKAINFGSFFRTSDAIQKLTRKFLLLFFHKHVIRPVIYLIVNHYKLDIIN